MLSKFILSNLLGSNLSDLHRSQLVSLFLKGQEIEEIGDRIYITNEKKGIGFVFDQMKNLIAIHFHAKSKGHNTYSGLLPFEINFDDTANVIHQKIGNESFESGGGEVVPVLGRTNQWRRYSYATSYLTIEYNEMGTVALITMGLQQ